MSKPSSHGENLVLTAKEAHSLIALSRSSSLLSLLKHPDFAMVAAIAFAGFRVDSNGLSNPIVRRRLADEAVRNAEFAEKLRETAQPQPAPSSPHPSAVIPTRQAPRSAAAIAPDAVAEKYKAERDRLKRELAEEANDAVSPSASWGRPKLRRFQPAPPRPIQSAKRFATNSGPSALKESSDGLR